MFSLTVFENSPANLLGNYASYSHLSADLVMMIYYAFDVSVSLNKHSFIYAITFWVNTNYFYNVMLQTSRHLSSYELINSEYVKFIQIK